MADDVKNVASETPAGTSPPTEQNLSTSADTNTGGTEKSGGLIQGITDAFSTLKDTASGNKDKTDKGESSKSETSTDKTQKDAADVTKTDTGNALEQAGQLVGNVKDAIKTAAETAGNAKDALKTAAETAGNATGQSSVAQQMKELGEVQVDKAFVDNSLNMLGTLSFDQLIGGPLRAAIKAQRDMAKETLSYIREEGLTTDDSGQSKVTYVTLNFVRNGKQVKMRVPLLTLMPVPRLSITSMTYTFKARVNAQSAAVVTAGSGASPILQSQTSTDSTPQAPSANADKAALQKQNTGSAAKSTTTADGKATDGTSDTSGTTTKTTMEQNAITALQTTTSATAPTFTASLSSKKDSGATRDSRYSIETTMDISVTASEGDMPCGIDRLLSVLDSSAEEYDPAGTLQVSADQTTLVSGYAALTVSYRDGMGVFQPEAIGCSPLEGNGKQPSLLVSGNDKVLVFSEKGAYKVTAGSQQRIVFVS